MATAAIAANPRPGPQPRRGTTKAMNRIGRQHAAIMSIIMPIPIPSCPPGLRSSEWFSSMTYYPQSYSSMLGPGKEVLKGDRADFLVPKGRLRHL